MENAESSQLEPGTPEASRPPLRRLLGLGFLCLIIAVAVVLVIAWFNPPEEPASLPAALPLLDSPSPPLPSVHLPTSAASISNEQLQAEALQEIEGLQSRLQNSPESLHVAAMAYAGLRQTQKAEELWRSCIQLEPQHVGPRVGLATLHIDRGEDQKAIEILEAALAENCVSPEVFYRLATAKTKLGHVDQAEAVLQTAVETFPLVSENWLLLGETSSQLNKFEEAEASLHRAIELGNHSPTVYFALATACQRQGKQEQAAQYRKIFSDLKAKDSSDARDQTFHQIYQQALRPLVAGSYASAAAVYIKRNQPDEGERLFLRALEIVPDDPQVLEELASFYREVGRIADARVVQERLLALAPDNVIYLVNLANLASQLGDLQSALQTLEEARRRMPDFALPYAGLAQLHAQLGNLEQARLFAEGAVRREPTIQGYGILATICQQLGDEEAAQAARERAKQLAAPSR